MLSLGPQHSFPLEDVFDYLHPETARDVLVQALLAAPDVHHALAMERAALAAARALTQRQAGAGAAPAHARRRPPGRRLSRRSLACPETLPGGPIEVPMEHPIVRQTVEDCLTEAMDVEGFLEVLEACATAASSGARSTRRRPRPSPAGSSRAALRFLDDAPLEERRTQAVIARRVLDDADRGRAGRPRSRGGRAGARGGLAPARQTRRRCTRRCSGWGTSTAEEAPSLADVAR